MIRTAASFSLLLSAITLVAQNGVASSGVLGNGESPSPAQAETQSNSIPTGLTVSSPKWFGSCPIDMHATQGLWDRTVRVRDGDKAQVPHQFGQRIFLNLKDHKAAHIVSATVRVRGLNGTSRALPTPANTAQRWNATRTLKVDFVKENDGAVSADLRLAGFTAVDSIQLIGVSYSDGSVWRISGSSDCRVQPDPLMLITER